jgi:peptidoglycan/LPS O-acetylase OafA/YrhL
MWRILRIEGLDNRIFGLDLLRFIAIFMVLVGHSMMFVPESIKKVCYRFMLDGVGIFFVLSGFLIGGILIRILNKKNAVTFANLVDFWKRRWMRTLPAYLVVLLFLLI